MADANASEARSSCVEPQVLTVSRRMPKTAAPEQMSTGSQPEPARNKVSLVDRPESGDVPSVFAFAWLPVDAFWAAIIRWRRSAFCHDSLSTASALRASASVKTAEPCRPDRGVHDPGSAAPEMLVSEFDIYP